MLKNLSLIGLNAGFALVFATVVNAQETSTKAVTADAAPAKACVQQTSLENVPDDLKNDPAKFLAGFADGGGSVVRNIRALLVADSTNASKIAKTLSGLNDKQAFSVGVGMGQAAAACSKGNTPAAIAIQQAVAESGNASALAGFSQAFGNLLVASTGGGRGAGGLPSGTSSAIGTGFEGGGKGSTNNSAFVDSTTASTNQSGNFLTGSIFGSNEQRTRSLLVPVSPGTL